MECIQWIKAQILQTHILHEANHDKSKQQQLFAVVCECYSGW